MRIALLPVLTSLLVIAPASAAPVWYTGFELGADPTAGLAGELAPTLFSALPPGTCRAREAASCWQASDCPAGIECALPYAVDAAAPPDPGNAFSLRIDAPSAATARFETLAFPPTADALVCFDLLLHGQCRDNPSVTCTTDGDCGGARPVCRGPLDAPIAFAFEDARATRQCVGTIGCARGVGCDDWALSAPATQHLRLYFNRPDRFECIRSPVDGRACGPCGRRCVRDQDVTCTTHAQCLRRSLGSCEATDQCADRDACGDGICARGEHAASDRIAYGRWTHLCIRNRRTGTQQIRCALYQNRHEVGGSPHRQGYRQGGRRHGTPGAADSQCPEGGHCGALETAVSEVSQFAFGVLTPSSSPLSYAIDNLAIYDLAADPDDLDRALRRRWATLRLAGDRSADVARSGCHSARACLSDTAGAQRSDGDATRIALATAGARADVGLAAPPLGYGETVEADAWLALSCAVKTAGAARTPQGLRYGFADSNGAHRDFREVEVAAAGGAGYVAPPTAIATLAAAGGTRAARVADTRVFLEHAGGAGPRSPLQVSTCRAQLAYTSAPERPPDLPWLDVNGDGVTSVGYANDSRWVPEPLSDTILAALPGLDNLVSCATGGRAIADFANHAGAIADGTAANVSVRCQVKRGQRTNIDVLFFDAGANDLSFPMRPEGTCFQSWCAGDPSIKCAVDEECGAHGPCGGGNHLGPCDLPRDRSLRTAADPMVPRCLRGIHFGEPCRRGEGSCGYCARAPAQACASNFGCEETTGPCRVGAPPHYTCSPDETWCHAVTAEVNERSPQCAGGFCIQRPALALIEKAFRRAVETWRARRGDRQVSIVLAPAYAPVGSLAFGCQADAFRALARSVKEYAQQEGLAWIDQAAYLDARAPNRDAARGPAGAGAFLLDWIHPTDDGAALIGQAMSDCLLGRYDQAMDCRPLLRACTADEQCPPGTTCADWPIGETAYCQIPGLNAGAAGP